MSYETISHPIMLIDDNNLDIDLFQRALKKANADIKLEIARGGEQALEYIQQWESGTVTPIVILLDLNMPNINGLDVLRVLKSHPRFKIIPIVVLTSSNETENIERAYALGANSYITKSVNYDEFAKAVALIHHYWCQLNVSPE